MSKKRFSLSELGSPCAMPVPQSVTADGIPLPLGNCRGNFSYYLLTPWVHILFFSTIPQSDMPVSGAAKKFGGNFGGNRENTAYKYTSISTNYIYSSTDPASVHPARARKIPKVKL